ncbi:PQ-loop repeat family protein / transmembrane family protein [Citrus sinensis]|uniref:PQ-loop repeat family protein / transmembrane family protein n=1 Tax=Citrus sinensis TaxID=2711 RepID=A0ACB8J1K0_CITSI|nr:PQ-loop repeat family protein / transmembrane family protein [Citrus sinensis]
MILQEEDEKKPLAPKSGDAAIPIPKASVKSSPRREYYYTSARSLASSGTPPFRTFLRAAQSGPSALGLDNDSSSDDEAAAAVPTLSSSGNPQTSQPRAIPRSAGYGTFLAASVNLPFQSNALAGAMAAGFHSRTLLNGNNMEHSAFGQWLGWLMAAIYMGGRLPQIWLNIKRGSVEGLNPLMFVFALVANVTYVLSIVVRTTEWESIKANMPWLLDAIVCVLLDLFYIYYRYFRKKSADYGEDDDGDYVDATKAND